MIRTGNVVGALQHAKTGHTYAEHLGDIYSQAKCLCHQGLCLLTLGHYEQGQLSLENARNFLNLCGLQEGVLYVQVRNHEAEIHLVKTEYLQSRHIQLSIVAHSHPTTYAAVVANLNIALIDTMIGVESKLVHQNLDTCRLHIKGLQDWFQIYLNLVVDQIYADIALRGGDHNTANMLLTQTFASSRYIHMDVALPCLARLADLSTEMSNVKTAMSWAGIFIALALKSKDKLSKMKAFHCLGQIFITQGDDATALSLFTVALDGLTFMGVHHWRADCMVHMANIWEHRREMVKSVELWKTARPLFQRSSQAKDVTRIDRKLADVDSEVMEVYEKQLQHLQN
jgi:hypothetical protein